jgi:glycine/serine hydroxymethyltransferase
MQWRALQKRERGPRGAMILASQRNLDLKLASLTKSLSNPRRHVHGRKVYRG